MSLKNKLHDDMVTAMKNFRRLDVTVLRAVIGEINTREKGGKTPIELDDLAITKLLQKEAAKRRESAAIYTAVGATPRAALELQEAEIIEAYLPAALTEAEVLSFIEEAITEVTANGGPVTMRHMGSVMKAVTLAVAGRFDGKQVSNMVKEHLAA